MNNVTWKDNINPNIDGGFLGIYNSTCNLTNSKIVNNSASIGGAIFTDECSYLTITNSTLENNEALIYGDQFASYPNFIEIEVVNSNDLNPLFVDYQNYTIELKTQTQNFSHYFLNNVSDYGLSTTLILIKLIDNFNQTMVLRDSVKIYWNRDLDITSSFDIYNNTRFITLPKSLITFSDLGQRSDLNLSVHYQGSKMELNLSFVPRFCLPGEYDDSSRNYRCHLCGYGFYSLKQDQNCLVCPSSGLICNGGNIINTTEGYWLENSSIHPIACLNETLRCKGGRLFDQCSKGFSGALCQGCDAQNDYTLSIGNQCKKCSTNLFNMVISYAASWIGSYALELYFLYTLIESNKNFVKMNTGSEESKIKLLKFKQKYYQGIETRLFTNYSQITYIIYIYVQYTFLQLIEYVNNAILAFSLISNPSSQQSSSLECIFLRLGISPDGLVYFKLKYWISMPIIKIFLTIIILALLRLKGKIHNLKNMIITSAIFILMNEQPGLLLNLGKFSSCFLAEATGGPGYVQLDPNISCADPQYERFSKNFAIPAILFWGGVLPIAIFLILYISRHRLDNPEFRIKYGGIINSYRNEVYYWGLVTMIYKLCLLLSLILIQAPSTAFFTGLSITLVYYYLFRSLQPYSSKAFVDLENYSILTFILTLYLLSYSSDGRYSTLLKGCALLIIITNLAMIVYFAKKIIARILENRTLTRKINMDQGDRGISMIEDKSTSLSTSLLSDPEES